MTIYFFLLLFLNLWSWRIFSNNLLIGILLVLVTIFVKKKWGILLFLILIFIQIKTTHIVPLTQLDDVEITEQIRRMRAYNTPRIAHILEERNEALIFYKMQSNLANVVDPNFYFFANHPRERAGVHEFEKFAYILLPFFVIGFYKLVVSKKYKFIILFLLLPLSIISIIGLDNVGGPFILFPFIFTSVYEGFIKRPVFVVIYLLVFLQTLRYGY